MGATPQSWRCSRPCSAPDTWCSAPATAWSGSCRYSVRLDKVVDYVIPAATSGGALALGVGTQVRIGTRRARRNRGLDHAVDLLLHADVMLRHQQGALASARWTRRSLPRPTGRRGAWADGVARLLTQALATDRGPTPPVGARHGGRRRGNSTGRGRGVCVVLSSS